MTNSITKAQELAIANEALCQANDKNYATLRALGFGNHVTAMLNNDYRLNLAISQPMIANTIIRSIPSTSFGIEMLNQFGEDVAVYLGAVRNSEVNSGAENLWTRQARIVKSIKNTVAAMQVSFGRSAKSVILNPQLAAAIKDQREFLPVTAEKQITQSTLKMYQVGTLELSPKVTVALLVNPQLAWSDTAVVVHDSEFAFDEIDLPEDITALSYALYNGYGSWV